MRTIRPPESKEATTLQVHPGFCCVFATHQVTCINPDGICNKDHPDNFSSLSIGQFSSPNVGLSATDHGCISESNSLFALSEWLWLRNPMSLCIHHQQI
jgi:hypothetical protein